MTRLMPVLTTVTIFCWSLWFGGMISLVLFVTRLFSISRDVAVHAAPVLFRSFAVYQLIVGVVACAAGALLALLTRRKSQAVMTLFMVVALGLALVIRAWTNEMMMLDRSDPQQVARFQALHHGTTRLYTTAACLLLVAGVGLVISFSAPANRRAGETAPA